MRNVPIRTTPWLNDNTYLMDKIHVTGGAPLHGTVQISGAKNSALPCIAASLLTSDPVVLKNIPRRVRDVLTMIQMLQHLGVESAWDGEDLVLQGRRVDQFDATYDIVKTMRASVLVLGPLVARFGTALVSLPGGCAIGARPIDMHLKGLEALGAAILLEHGYVRATASRLRGARFRFPGVTVTGTENILMAAALAEGETVLENCAIEPEIGDLVDLLNAMGARIKGRDTQTLVVEGVESLHGAAHSVIPDRIETGTFLIAGAVTRGSVTVTQCNPGHLGALIATLRRNGCHIDVGRDAIHLEAPARLAPSDVQTEVYPGFPTDLQAQYMALMTQADGVSVIDEHIFENRFMHVGELLRMGADVRAVGHRAEVHGRTPLSGAGVMATDLRASACLILAGLVAEGDTVIQRVYHIDRGYERIEEKLRGLGAVIERIR